MRAALGVLVGLLVAPGAARAQQVVDQVVGSVDGDPITMHDVEAFAASTGNPITPGTAGSSETAKAALKALIAAKLLEQEVKKYEDKVDESEVDKYITALRSQKHLSDEQFRGELMRNGISYDDFRKRARLEIEKMAMIDKEVRDKVVIPQTDIQAYYDAHKDEFTIEKERLRIAQILIAVPNNATGKQITDARKKADALRARVAKGEDFGTLARHYSDDASKTNGGELGWFAPADVMDEILAAVRPLKPGDISPVVHTKYGFHILKLEDHEVPGMRPLADVREQIREKLQDERAQSQLESWVETDLVKQHYVETNF